MTSWPLDPEQLRHEVEAMRAAVLGAVFARLGHDRLRGVYFKGSASKPWPDPIDYVPELSDVDLHLWLRDPQDRHQLTAPQAALGFMAEVNAAYAAACPRPLHWPRLQLSLLNDLLEMPRFARSAVTVLHGEPYPGTAPDPEHDRLALIEQDEAARHLGADLFDKVGPHQYAALRGLAWRVTPAAPRLLHALGLPWEEAWGQPRSVLVTHLQHRGHGALADTYRAYYGGAWRAFGSGWRDAAALHGALTLGYEVLRYSGAVARSLAPLEPARP
ncbi:hypothetical protein [Deinococcus sp. NW-56]|uniref:hypothetical protein n=1 Tax=Deinococcus sp. NW-56 TaxID=2080419 RepID=UPI000CF4B5C0|nr:hypothetical protein [Deinococcus sp. NW-56]